MVYESSHIRVTAEYGTATLWLQFPGEPANAFDLDRLRELETALRTLEANPSIRILVLRSGFPGAFCPGLRPQVWDSFQAEADAAAFSWFGQRVADRLAQFPAVTLAFIDGPCLGVGLELALACDYRLALANVAAPIGFAGASPCFGGSVRLPLLVGRRRAAEFLSSGREISAREAKAMGLVHHAFCERRAKIELRSFLDALERNPRKPRRSLWPQYGSFANERRHFARSAFDAKTSHSNRVLFESRNPIPPLPDVVGLASHEPAFQHLAADLAMRGVRVLTRDSNAAMASHIQFARARGFLTPLEAEQAQGRIVRSDSLNAFHDARLVFAHDADTAARLAPFVRPRCVIAVHGLLHLNLESLPFPRRVLGMRFMNGEDTELRSLFATDSDTLAAVAAWLRSLGRRVRPAMPAAANRIPFLPTSSRDRVAA